jgi:hypothetical protein
MKEFKRISIDYLPVCEIIPYKNNPRKNDRAVEIVQICKFNPRKIRKHN